MTDIPIVMGPEGAIPQTPAALRAAVAASIASTNPGYTANLPGSMIEDMLSTEVGSLVEIDTAYVDAINGVTPRGANAFILKQQGAIYGVQIGAQTNTSVFVVFTGNVGFVIRKGFTVGDGQFQYVVEDGGIINSGGQSAQIFCVATEVGTWSVPSGTVTQIITSVPDSVTLSVNNPSAGTPGASSESEASYRAAVLTAGQAIGVGIPSLLKTRLRTVSGVQPRLINTRQVIGGGWEVIVGGGDPFQVAYEIYRSILDISTLVGSTISVTGITKANPGVVTTDLNHGYASGQIIQMNGVVGMTQVNGINYTATVIDEKHFSIGVNTSGFGTYVSGGVVTPNFRNITPSINDYPDLYFIPYVNPPQQDVNITLIWNTNSQNFVSPAAVAQIGGQALVDYVNAIPSGAPMNLFELQTTFQQAISSILDPALLTRMVFTVSINNIGTSPAAGTGIIAGDPESFFLTDIGKVDISQG